VEENYFFYILKTGTIHPGLVFVWPKTSVDDLGKCTKQLAFQWRLPICPSTDTWRFTQLRYFSTIK